MKYCLNTSTIKPVSLLEKIRLVGEAGFDGIELWLNDVLEFVCRGGEVSDVEKALEDQNLFVPSVIAMRQWGDFDGWEHQLVLDEARRRFALGAELGAPFIVATPPLENPRTEHLAERYRELLEIGRQEGIRPTFEYISFFKSVHTLNKAWEIVCEADDSDATLILDAFHNWNSNSTLEDLKKFHSIVSVTTTLMMRIRLNRHKRKRIPTDPSVMPGDGHFLIDLKSEIQVLKEIVFIRKMIKQSLHQSTQTKKSKFLIRIGGKRIPSDKNSFSGPSSPKKFV